MKTSWSLFHSVTLSLCYFVIVNTLIQAVDQHNSQPGMAYRLERTIPEEGVRWLVLIWPVPVGKLLDDLCRGFSEKIGHYPWESNPLVFIPADRGNYDIPRVSQPGFKIAPVRNNGGCAEVFRAGSGFYPYSIFTWCPAKMRSQK